MTAAHSEPPPPRPRRMLGQTPHSAPFTEELPPAVEPHIGERDDDDGYPDPDLYDEPQTEWREAIGGAEGDPLPLPERSERTGDWKDWTRGTDPYAHDQYDDADDRSYDAQLVDYGGGGRISRSSSGGGVARIVAGVAAVCLAVGLVVVVVGINMGVSGENDAVAATATPGGSVFDSTGSASATPAKTTGPAGPASVAVPEPGAHATVNCTRIRTPSITTGANAGDDKDAPGVILALEWAYYVDRDAEAIYALLAPGTKLGEDTPAKLQAYIDANVPAATKYCVKIVPHGLTGNQWAVDIDEQRPGEGIDHLLPQLISTVTSSDGKTYITAIADR